MSAVAAERSGRLPRGWGHLLLQLAIWLGFYGAYQVARGAADRNVVEAFQNGEWILRTQRELGALFEPALQRVVDGSSLLVALTSYTYWLSQFAVIGITLLWVYFRRHERFAGFRNWLIAANLVGLIGYVLVPTAPPRMFPEWGFADTLAQYAAISHESGLIAWGSNPYAAMPSLHAMDAFIVGAVMVGVVRSRWAKALWLLWPAWVAFAVISTGNHYWLDVVAGIAIALATGAVLRRLRNRGVRSKALRARGARAGRLP
ncbi:MAG TPA: phosphatase PAP2 family protein [Gaiellaceae bacterium]|nr:phosphatase PAP2 family protein [Gaiellaceae bacterium]